MGDLTQNPAPNTGHVDKIARNGDDAGGPPTTVSSQDANLTPTSPDPSNQQEAFAAQLDLTNGQHAPRQGAYNMSPMANALPQVPYRGGQYHSGGSQRFNPAASPPVIPQVAQMAQFGPSATMSVPGQGYYPQQAHMHQYYGGQMSPTQSANAMPARQNMGFYPSQMMMGHYYPGAQYGQQGQGMPSSLMQGQYMPSSPTNANDPRTMPPNSDAARLLFQQSRGGPSGVDPQQSTVRGPPRKPRQSGHAIWIGNLPPQTDLMSLVHHVCREATGLESLFLISKSNCAFANFKDEATCVAAQQKLHDSKFQSVRLVSRLRKSAVEGAGGTIAPTGPSASTSNAAPAPNSQEDTPNLAAEEDESSTPALSQTSQARPNPIVDGAQQDRFFILKSLTVEDLELSVRTGIWATQSHNEDVLNSAFKASENVYLVFSANKSGEYFGYARMTSEIDNDPESAIEFAPKVQAAADIDLPKAIPTDATEHAPKGRIIDDSARGTIFWELDHEDSEGGSGEEHDEEEESEVASSKETEGEEDGAKTWGKPFKLEWLSNNRLPFYRTRGLRNPWNSNREVKIARDGTELEPIVGRKLIGLFNRWQNPTQYAAPMRTTPMGMVPNFPQAQPQPPMRPYGS